MFTILILLALAVIVVSAWPDSFYSDYPDYDDCYLDDVEDDDAEI